MYAACSLRVGFQQLTLQQSQSPQRSSPGHRRLPRFLRTLFAQPASRFQGGRLVITNRNACAANRAKPH